MRSCLFTSCFDSPRLWTTPAADPPSPLPLSSSSSLILLHPIPARSSPPLLSFSHLLPPPPHPPSFPFPSSAFAKQTCQSRLCLFNSSKSTLSCFREDSCQGHTRRLSAALGCGPSFKGDGPARPGTAARKSSLRHSSGRLSHGTSPAGRHNEAPTARR